MIKATTLIALRGLHPKGSWAAISTLACAALGALSIFTGYLSLGFASIFQSNCIGVIKQFEGEFKVIRNTAASSDVISANAEELIHKTCMTAGVASAALSIKTKQGLAEVQIEGVSHQVEIELLGLGKASGTPPRSFVSGQYAALGDGIVLADWGLLGFAAPAGKTKVKIIMNGQAVSLVTSTGSFTPSPLLKRPVVVLAIDDLRKLLALEPDSDSYGADAVLLFARPGGDVEPAARALGTLLQNTPATAGMLVTYWKDRVERLIQLLKALWLTIFIIILAVTSVCLCFATCNLLAIRRGHREADLAFLACGLSPKHWRWIAATRGFWLGGLSVVMAAVITLIVKIVLATFPGIITTFAALRGDSLTLVSSFILVSIVIVLLFVVSSLVADSLHNNKVVSNQ